MSYSKEEKTLLRLSKLRKVSPSTDKLSSDINLPKFFELSYKNGMLPYVLFRLVDISSNSAYSTYTTFAHNLKLKAMARQLEYAFLKNKFDESGIDFIPLKGILLSQLVYPDTSLRDMFDIDILININDSKKIASLLKNLDYAEFRSDPSIHTDILPLLTLHKSYQKYFNSSVYVRDNSRLELRFELSSSRLAKQLSNQELWNLRRLESINSKNIYTLSPEHQLINLTTHCTQHNFGFGIRAISEIDAAIDYYGDNLNWEKLLDILIEKDLQALAYVPLLLSKTFYDSSIPNDFLGNLKAKCPNVILNLGDQVAEDYFNREKVPLLKDNSHFLEIFSQKNFISTMMRIFFPPVKIMQLKSRGLFSIFPFIYLQYPLRSLMLIFKYSPTLIKRIVLSLRSLLWKTR